jgi:hypothetical protein
MGVLAIGPLPVSCQEMGWSNVWSTPRSMDSTGAVMRVLHSVNPRLAIVCNSLH